jgi:hypothetical protein
MEIAPSSEPLTIPPDLLAQIREAADEEHRSALAVLQDAVKRYVQAKRRDRQVFRTQDLSAAELAAITSGGMDARHNHLNAELE